MSRSNIKNRDLEEGYEYIGGRNVINEALKAGRNIKKIYLENAINAGKDERIHAIISNAKNKGISISPTDKAFLKKIENQIGVSSEGVVAIVQSLLELDTNDLIALCIKKNKLPFIIIVNNILYEENLGAILRTASACGVDGIIIPKRDRREVNANVERISMGGASYVPVIRDNLFTSIDTIKRAGIKVVGVELNGDKYYFDEDLTGSIALVFGGEDAGLTKPLEDRCDSIVKIPMIGSIQSLNVSVSTGIVIYEKLRQECQN